ncbi:hypothetical protein DL762_001556 [Monosporascus cannonballus]|uniref:Heterokaryon incompatibility domain-containing protein n=1 Tax=Monosporascus cannonballus TaxID=155416 RepID=A0ABY0HGK9_9PEZI|nr:hypothetical protein DL762_001556 [Monosporascus cannonballus]RYO94641.1 hypothetical protein DL763_004008 [Monosporascus cannonballus]
MSKRRRGPSGRDTRLLARLARDERPSDLRSELCLSMGADWLNKCSREHAKCKANQNEQTLLPTRVIDVGSTLTQPRLYISGDGEAGKWVALSYCWGGDSGFTLNAASFSSLRSGLPLSDFPSTLRDAVLVTRALGVHYLWIDCLCIFQDDINNWAVEASRMSDVYSDVVVTIAATSAESVNDGFLDRREPHFNCPFPWRRHDHPGSVTDRPHAYPIFLRAPPEHSSHRRRQQSLRWATRGWTFQEELLSKRLLYYMTGRMIWYCRAGKATEPAEEPEGDMSLFSTLKDLPPQSANPENFRAATYKAWYKLLGEYTKRHLTFDKDRLPAIGAFAKFFNARLRDQYCAGLWRGDLLYGLLWGVHSTPYGSGTPGSPPLRARLRISGHEDNHTAERPVNKVPVGISSEHCGPSWSWVRANSAVGLTWPQVGSLTYLARIVHVEVRGTLHDDFGCVEGGELVLDAPYRHLHLRLGSYSGTLWSPASLAQRVLTRLGPLASTKKLAEVVLTRPDFLASTHTSRSVIVPSSSTEFTLIQFAKTNYRPVLYLLLLQPQTTNGADCGRPQRYRRVGLLELQPWRYDDENFIGEEIISRLESAANSEVSEEEWPTRTFVIV